MKLLKITTLYPAYLADFFLKNRGLEEKTFTEQKAAIFFDASGWADFWSHALSPLGYDVMEITMNVESMQRAWATENSLPDPNGMGLKEIALAQVIKFKPDILWFDDPDASLLCRMRMEVPSIRLVLGWSGSAIPNTDAWRHMDLILSCAPEAVEYFRKAGHKAAHLDHGFDSRINERLIHRPKLTEFSFIGQLLRCSGFHLLREQLLEELAIQSEIAIYSSSEDFKRMDDIKFLLAAGLYDVMQFARKAGFTESLLYKIPVVARAARFESRPRRTVNPILKKFLKPAVFGLDMFQVLCDSKIVLNVHADSSPRYASNMRLFETTGVGTCLLTDWKENLAKLFEPDKEVIVYRSAEECAEKVRWLLEHPKECDEIGKAGMLKTLNDHTFFIRAVQLNEMIRSGVKAS